MGIRIKNKGQHGLPVSLTNEDLKVGSSLMLHKERLFLIRRTGNLRPLPPSGPLRGTQGRASGTDKYTIPTLSGLRPVRFLLQSMSLLLPPLSQILVQIYTSTCHLCILILGVHVFIHPERTHVTLQLQILPQP